jgi:hypothetical protein
MNTENKVIHQYKNKEYTAKGIHSQRNKPLEEYTARGIYSKRNTQLEEYTAI